MSHKTSPARRAAFFAALAEAGNQTIAAERARVSRSWVHLHQSTDPLFRAELDAAIATAKERLRTRAEGVKPAAGWGHQDGEELVVRGTNGRRTQIARARLKQWTPRAEARFLSALATCCNVKAACAAVGLTQASAYGHRERWAAFAERWDQAIALGYERIEAAMLENACNVFSTPEVEPACDMPPMSVEQAMHLLHMHQKRVHGVGGRPGAPRQPSDGEAVLAALNRDIDRVLRQEQRGRIDPAADRRAVERGARIVRGEGDAGAAVRFGRRARGNPRA